MKKYVILFIALPFFIVACQQDIGTFNDYARPDLPDQSVDYKSTDQKFMSLFLQDFTPFDNHITDAGATLGRVLFYDRMLSVNNSTSCGSCHFQNKAFADFASRSDGFRGGKTKRNSMSFTNLRGMGSFFWDIRANSLEEQVLMPVEDHIEMGMERMNDLQKKLALIDYYPDLFESAFGSKEITNEKISKALAQFLRSMVSADSKYDIGTRTGFSNFTSLESRGMELFTSWDGAGCNNCHSGENFNGWTGQFANIGLEMVYTDKGIPMDGTEGLFKVPSLRNIALTGPFMHDGRFETLEEVIDHYDNGIVDHPNLDWRLTEDAQGGGIIIFPGPFPVQPPFQNPGEIIPRKLHLSDYDKSALKAFLETLTDNVFINDPKFSDPF